MAATGEAAPFALTARMDRIAWVMGLARDELLREAGFELPR